MNYFQLATRLAFQAVVVQKQKERKTVMSTQKCTKYKHLFKYSNKSLLNVTFVGLKMLIWTAQKCNIRQFLSVHIKIHEKIHPWRTTLQALQTIKKKKKGTWLKRRGTIASWAGNFFHFLFPLRCLQLLAFHPITPKVFSSHKTCATYYNYIQYIYIYILYMHHPWNFVCTS